MRLFRLDLAVWLDETSWTTVQARRLSADVRAVAKKRLAQRLKKLLKRARHGARVVLIPGNHDEALREYVGSRFGDVHVVEEVIHTAADGRRYLLVHGDEFDQVTRYHRWLAVLGDRAYEFLVHLNVVIAWVRRSLRIAGYWSLAGYAKRKVKTAVTFIYDFEDAVAHSARQRGLDGVICGHIHAAAIRDIDGIRYVNCGDWVDSCTAIVEHTDGRLELIEWGKTHHPQLPMLATADEAKGDEPPSLPLAARQAMARHSDVAL
jgi:UDP-2,3-diacylglucosamine pyrophosphatase LpxH